MKSLMKPIDNLPLVPVALGALMLGLAPFAPEPHLFEKVKMLGAGTLRDPVDIFDLCMHGCLPVLLVIKLLSMRGKQER